MKDKNENIQTPVLFDDSVPCINTSSNDSNIIHKKTVTSIIHNNIEKPLNKKITYFTHSFVCRIKETIEFYKSRKYWRIQTATT